MQSTQLTCPHCGSTLNFGTAITAGTTVECLICMQPFPAEPLAATAPPPAMGIAVEKPKSAIAVGKPYAPPVAAPKVQRAKPASAPQRTPSASGNNDALL